MLPLDNYLLIFIYLFIYFSKKKGNLDSGLKQFVAGGRPALRMLQARGRLALMKWVFYFILIISVYL